MDKAKVYFTDFRTDANHNLLDKLRRLLEKAGMMTMQLEGKFTAIKIHFGEPGNLAFLRSNYAKVVVDALKDMGAHPFLTDCNTLYPRHATQCAGSYRCGVHERLFAPANRLPCDHRGRPAGHRFCECAC